MPSGSWYGAFDVMSSRSLESLKRRCGTSELKAKHSLNASARVGLSVPTLRTGQMHYGKVLDTSPLIELLHRVCSLRI